MNKEHQEMAEGQEVTEKDRKEEPLGLGASPLELRMAVEVFAANKLEEAITNSCYRALSNTLTPIDSFLETTLKDRIDELIEDIPEIIKYATNLAVMENLNLQAPLSLLQCVTRSMLISLVNWHNVETQTWPPTHCCG